MFLSHLNVSHVILHVTCDNASSQLISVNYDEISIFSIKRFLGK